MQRERSLHAQRAIHLNPGVCFAFQSWLLCFLLSMVSDHPGINTIFGKNRKPSAWRLVSKLESSASSTSPVCISPFRAEVWLPYLIWNKPPLDLGLMSRASWFSGGRLVGQKGCCWVRWADSAVVTALIGIWKLTDNSSSKSLVNETHPGNLKTSFFFKSRSI